MKWYIAYPGVSLGYLPDFFDEDDPRPAREQINERYAHGGGWMPQKGWRLLDNGRLRYGREPSLELLAHAQLRDEMIGFFQHEMVVIVQEDGSFEVCRID